MREGIRTLVFLAVAAVSVAAAAVVHVQSRPDVEAGFARLGEPFFEDFTDPTAAKSLEISEYDEDLATVRSFKVDYDEGTWRLASYHGYPAEAKERLYEIAAAFIGVQREALAGRFESSHRRYGVIAPDSEDMTALEGRGQRVVLKDANGKKLVDLIIGKRPEGQGDTYYVRDPDEDETYLVRLDLDEISTRFADWIEQDLLKLNAADLVLVERQAAETRLVPLTQDGSVRVFERTGGQTVTLTRDEAGFSEPWQLAGLDDPMMELKEDSVSTITGAIDSLEYEGVRVKPDWLTGDLTVDRSKFPDANARDFLVDYSPILVSALAQNGFRLAVEPKNLEAVVDPSQNPEELQFELYGEAGDLVVGTDEGLKYVLHFGNSFGGTRREIEVGKTGTVSAEGEDDPEDFLRPDEEGPDKAAEDGNPKPATGKTADESREEILSRFLLVRVAFDRSLVTGEPQKPEPPATDDGPAVAEKADAASSDNAQAEYEQALKDYEADLKTFEEKVAEYREKARDLNKRFARYYYLVSNDSYEKLVFTPDELTQPKTAEDEANSTETEAGPPSSQPPPFNLPGLPQQ